MAGRWSEFKVMNVKTWSLSEVSPDDRSFRLENREQDNQTLYRLGVEINRMQDILHAAGKQKVLLILQGMDASGKDGVVKHVFSECDPLGIRVASFKAPSAEELAHDYLWRVHVQVPKAGELVIFNRSHYEDVLIVRVHDWIDDKECQRRYQQINDFERMLTETGTTIIKCFLHISREEQKIRMQERLDNPEKTWKFNPGDLKERALWDTYMRQYEQVMKATSTSYAPWYVIPANSKTNRNLMISTLLLEVLTDLKLSYPVKPADYNTLVIED